MQINALKLKNKRRKKKTIGRGGKRGTYCGKGMKGQKSRSGAKINPLFEGGRSTLIDRMKKKRGFNSQRAKKAIVKLLEIEKNFFDSDKINLSSLIKAGLVDKIKATSGVKVLGGREISKKLFFDREIFLSESCRKFIEKAGGKIETGI